MEELTQQASQLVFAAYCHILVLSEHLPLEIQSNILEWEEIKD